MNPLFFGDYPAVMIERVAKNSKEEGFTQSRLPQFTSEEKKMLKQSVDFLGLNHYTTQLCYFDQQNFTERPSHDYDVGVVTYYDDSWTSSVLPWIKVVPWGLTKLLVWIKNHYNNPKILITENGYPDSTGATKDYDRISYLRGYLYAVLKAIRKHKCKVNGYTAWSLMDNFEWMTGYTIKFGLFNVDFNNATRPRTAKLSSYFYSNVISNRTINF